MASLVAICPHGKKPMSRHAKTCPHCGAMQTSSDGASANATPAADKSKKILSARPHK